MAKPNILFIMADQLMPQWMGAYGHAQVPTPNISELAKNGIRFDNAYTPCPVCAPARAAMFSGRYASDLGVFDNGTCYSAEHPTFAHALRQGGYDVVCSGKMHFVGPDQLHGLNERLTTDIYPSSFDWVPSWEKDREEGIKNVQGKFADSAGVSTWTRQLTYDEEVHHQALKYLRDKQVNTHNKPDNEKPFCLIASYTQPHSPFLTTEEYFQDFKDSTFPVKVSGEAAKDSSISMDKWIRKYSGISEESQKDDEKIQTMRKAYSGMVKYIDDKVGELVNTLKHIGLYENTVVIFTSDHGEMLGERGLVEKRNFYEPSARIPLIISDPRSGEKGCISNAPASLLDIFPTLTHLTQSPTPPGLDGENLFKDLSQEREILSEYHGEGVIAPCFMIRSKQYKYIYVGEDQHQLFNLETDPNEVVNLANQESYQELVSELRSKILQRFNPEKIEQDVLQKQKQAKFISESLDGDIASRWDHCPQYPGKTCYER